MRDALLIGMALFIDVFLQGVLGLATFALQILPVIGQAAAMYAAAIGEIISATFGAALIIMLLFTGLFSWSAVMGGGILEMIPIINLFVPGWTLAVWRCIQKEKQAQKAKQQAAPTVMSAPEAPQPFAFEDIRAANDNQPYAQAA